MTAAVRAPGGGGSGQTQMQNPAQGGGRASPAITAPAPRQAVLHLRGATREEERERGQEGESERRGISWAEDVVDNEGMGRKSSKGLFRPFCVSFVSLSSFEMMLLGEGTRQVKG
jgi:protein phosphatase 1 regulatory subunit 11